MGLHAVIPLGKTQKFGGVRDPRAKALMITHKFILQNLHNQIPLLRGPARRQAGAVLCSYLYMTF